MLRNLYIAVLFASLVALQAWGSEVSMSNSGGVIQEPVGEKDVQVVLGTSENTWKGLCTHPNINKWSKRRPVTFANTVRPLTDSEFKYNVYFGFKMPVFESMVALKNALLNGTTEWAFDKPYGTMASPYRITDFNGYNHSSKEPFSQITQITFNINANQTQITIARPDIPYTVYDAVNGNTSWFTDVPDPIYSQPLDKWYFGALLIKDSSTYVWATIANPINNSNRAVILEGISSGTWYLYWFLANRVNSKSTTPLTSDRFVPTHIVEPHSILIKSISSDDNVYVTFTAYAINTNNVNYEIKLENDRATSFTFRQLKFTIYRVANAGIHWNDGVIVGEKSLGDVTLASGVIQNITGSMTTSTLDWGYHYWVVLRRTQDSSYVEVPYPLRKSY